MSAIRRKCPGCDRLVLRENYGWLCLVCSRRLSKAAPELNQRVTAAASKLYLEQKAAENWLRGSRP